MRVEIEIRALYKKLLSVFELAPLTTDLLTRIMAGSEKANDYEEILKTDKFFTTLLCRQASATMKETVVTSLAHGVVVVGQQRVRDAILGHQITRIFKPFADNEFEGMEVSEKNVKFALRAEEQAKKCRNEYTGMAYAAGYLFDIFALWLAQDEKLTESYGGLLESTWKHGVRTATLAWALATHERIFIPVRKIIFTSALLHDIGKLGLAVAFPKEYLICLNQMRDAHETNYLDDAYEAVLEAESFDLTHNEIGSALLFQTKALRELEMDVDYHHDSILLKTRNPDAFLGAAVVNIANRISFLLERKPNFEMEELQEILKPHANHFPLKAHDVMELFAQVRSRGLLAT